MFSALEIQMGDCKLHLVELRKKQVAEKNIASCRYKVNYFSFTFLVLLNSTFTTCLLDVIQILIIMTNCCGLSLVLSSFAVMLHQF